MADVPHERLIVSSATSRKEGCTTDAEEIAAALAGDLGEAKLLMVVVTYKSLPKVSQVLRERGLRAGLAVFDTALSAAEMRTLCTSP